MRDGDLDKDGYMHHYLDYGAMITRDYVAYMDSFDTGKCVWLDLKTGAEKSRSYDVLYNRVTMNRMLANENHLVFMCDGTCLCRELARVVTSMHDFATKAMLENSIPCWL